MDPSYTGAKITVVVRKRPLGKKELAKGETDVVDILDEATIIVKEVKQKVDLTKYVEEHNFIFDMAFDQSTSNEQLYQVSVRPIIEAAFNRAKVTCFAYGQTGSGKTHTMIGDLEAGIPGLYLLASYDIFNLLNSPQFSNLHVTISFYEIYCGKLFDLLNEKNPLQAREDAKGNVNIIGLSEKKITNPQQLMAIIQQGQKERVTSSNSSNSESSRSHALLQIHLKQGKQIFGKLSFIDLAGSERGADVSDQNKQTRIDGAEINKSLLALKECIRAIDLNKNHTPFRGSKLTLVLKDSFTGNCRTVMIGNISPSSNSSEHTLNTLRYADRVKELKKPQDHQMSLQDYQTKELGLARQNNNIIKKAYKNPEDEDDEEEDFYNNNNQKFNMQGHQGLMKQTFPNSQQQQQNQQNQQNQQQQQNQRPNTNNQNKQPNLNQKSQSNNSNGAKPQPQQQTVVNKFGNQMNTLMNNPIGGNMNGQNNGQMGQMNLMGQNGQMGQQNQMGQIAQIAQLNQQNHNQNSQMSQNNQMNNQMNQLNQINQLNKMNRNNQVNQNNMTNNNSNINSNNNSNNMNNNMTNNSYNNNQIQQNRNTQINQAQTFHNQPQTFNNQQQAQYNNQQFQSNNNNNRQMQNNYLQPQPQIFPNQQQYGNTNQNNQMNKGNQNPIIKQNSTQQNQQNSLFPQFQNPQQYQQLYNQSKSQGNQQNSLFNNQITDEEFPEYNTVMMNQQSSQYSQSTTVEVDPMANQPALENFVDYQQSTKQLELQKLSAEHEELVQVILQEEEEVVNKHREQIDKMVELTKEVKQQFYNHYKEMVLLNKVDQPGSDIQTYVQQLHVLLDQKLNFIGNLKNKLNEFTQHLQDEEDLSRRFYEQRENIMNDQDVQQQQGDDLQLLDNLDEQY